MTKFTEGRHPGEVLLSEASGSRSRGTATIVSGSGVVKPGTVLGVVAASGKFTPSPNAEVVGFEGAQTAVAVALYGCDATTADQQIAIIERDAEVKKVVLEYENTVTSDAHRKTKATQLAAVGIIAR